MSKEKNNCLKELLNEYCLGIKDIYQNFKIQQEQVSKEDIKSIEQKLGFELNEELKEWFTIIGEAKYGLDGFLMGVEPYSLHEMYKEWMSWREFDNDEELNDATYYSSFPPEQIKCRYTNPKWIPLGHTYDSNYIGVDLDPDTKGTIGQIIDFGRDQNDKMVLASSITDFLRKMIQLQDEMFVREDEEADYYINEEDTHPIDWIKEMIEEVDEED